jgi:hypothetical protein
MKLGDHLQHGGRSRFRVSWRPILIDPPLPPSSSNTPAQRASNARARSSMLPGARRDLANVDRDSPPHPAELSHSRPTPAARPTTLRSRHRLACRAVPAPDAGGLRCRAAGWRACAPARPVYAGKSLPGRVGEAVNPPSSDPVGLRLRGGPAGNRRSARSGGTGTDLRLVEKVLGRSTVGALCALRSGRRRRQRPPGVGVTSGRCACSRRAATRKRWIPSLPATPSSYSAR